MGSIRKHNQTQNLFFDFRFKGVRCREYTVLPDTPSNRKKMLKLMDNIESAILLGTFNYRLFFPNSKNAAKFDVIASGVTAEDVSAPSTPMSGAVNKSSPLFKDFAETWFSEKSIEWRASHKKTVREVIDKRLCPRFGEQEVGRITKADILSFRADLAKVQARGKTSVLSNPRINKILNPLRQILNEAADRFDFRTPFQNIKQLRVKRVDVEPFTLDEVKRMIDTVRADFRNYFTVRFFTGK